MAARRRSAAKPKKRPRRGWREVLPKKKRASYTRHRSADGRFAKKSAAKASKKRAKRSAVRKVTIKRPGTKRSARIAGKIERTFTEKVPKKVSKRPVAPKKASTRPVAPKKVPKRSAAPKKVPKRSVAPKRPTSRVETRKKRVTPARRAAVTRALDRYFELPSQPRTQQQKDLRKKRRRELVATLERAGFSDASIRARIGWITRRRNQRGRTLADAQARALGRTTPLHGGESRENWTTLRGHLTAFSPEFQSFIEDAEDMGVGYDEAVDRWFSPTAE